MAKIARQKGLKHHTKAAGSKNNKTTKTPTHNLLNLPINNDKKDIKKKKTFQTKQEKRIAKRKTFLAKLSGLPSKKIKQPLSTVSELALHLPDNSNLDKADQTFSKKTIFLHERKQYSEILNHPKFKANKLLSIQQHILTSVQQEQQDRGNDDYRLSKQAKYGHLQNKKKKKKINVYFIINDNFF